MGSTGLSEPIPTSEAQKVTGLAANKPVGSWGFCAAEVYVGSLSILVSRSDIGVATIDEPPRAGSSTYLSHAHVMGIGPGVD